MRRILTGMLMLLPGMLHAAAPVPGEVVPERIAGAMPRNVVFILSDDHRHDAMQPGWDRWVSFAGQRH